MDNGHVSNKILKYLNYNTHELQMDSLFLIIVFNQVVGKNKDFNKTWPIFIYIYHGKGKNGASCQPPKGKRESAHCSSQCRYSFMSKISWYLIKLYLHWEVERADFLLPSTMACWIEGKPAVEQTSAHCKLVTLVNHKTVDFTLFTLISVFFHNFWTMRRQI